MKFPWIKKMTENQVDVMLTLTCFVVISCTVKFLFEGVTITLLGRTLDFGHADAMTYGALLGPTLGVQGYTHVRKQKRYKEFEPDERSKPDDPDSP